MKKRLVLGMVAVVAVLAVMGCASAPKWVETSNPKKPDREKIYGRGVCTSTSEAAGRMAAESRARLALVQQIQTFVQIMEDSKVATGSNAATDYFKGVAGILTERSLTQSRIIDGYHDKKTGTYYALASIDATVVETAAKQAFERAALKNEGIEVSKETAEMRSLLRQNSDIMSLDHD